MGQISLLIANLRWVLQRLLLLLLLLRLHREVLHSDGLFSWVGLIH